MSDDEERGEPCQKCGCPDALHVGFGLAGGGYGPYVYCTNDECQYFEKWQEKEP